MKGKIALLGLCVCALVQTSQAQQSDVGQVIIPALKNLEIKRVYMAPEDFKPYKGDYNLSNGKTMVLRRFNARMFAQVGTQSEHEIIPTGNGKFSALDRTMQMELTVERDGDITGTMSYIDEDIQKNAAALPKATIITVAIR